MSDMNEALGTVCAARRDKSLSDADANAMYRIQDTGANYILAWRNRHEVWEYIGTYYTEEAAKQAMTDNQRQTGRKRENVFRYFDQDCHPLKISVESE